MIKIIKMIALIILGFILIDFIIVVMFISFSPQFGEKSKGERLKKIERSKNYRNGKFINQHKIKDKFNFQDYMKFIPKLMKGGTPNSSPKFLLPVKPINEEAFAKINDTITSITWFGHSALFIKIDGCKILLDPMLGKVPSPVSFFGRSRFNKTLPISINDLPFIDAVIISHDHYDHLDYGSIKQLKDKVGHFYVPLGVGAHLIRWGVSENKITELDWWEKASFKDLTFVATPSQHFSGRGINDKMKTLWVSWVIIGKKHRIFFSGDSGYFIGFKEIGEKYGPFDITMIECGQYNELWSNIHIFPEQTAQAHLDLRGKVLMPIHWGAFALSTLHDWDESIIRVSKAAAELNINITTPMIGEEVILDTQLPNSKWWIK